MVKTPQFYTFKTPSTSSIWKEKQHFMNIFSLDNLVPHVDVIICVQMWIWWKSDRKDALRGHLLDTPSSVIGKCTNTTMMDMAYDASLWNLGLFGHKW